MFIPVDTFPVQPAVSQREASHCGISPLPARSFTVKIVYLISLVFKAVV